MEKLNSLKVSSFNKKRSRHDRNKANKKRKSEQTNIIFNPIQHRTQGGAEKLSASDQVKYSEEEWMSVPLCPSCRISSKKPTIQQSTKDLLIENLVKKSKLSANNSFDDEISSTFCMLINSIIESSESTVEDDEWIAFGLWLGFKEPIRRRDVHNHLKNKWKKLKYAMQLQSGKDLEVPEIIKSKQKEQLIISARNNNIAQFRYVIKPECIVDQDNRTLVHLEELNDYNAVIKATTAINNYYFHMLKKPSHRSHNFWENLTEHFGAFTDYTVLPYSSSDLASSHNINHQICVNNLLYALQPLSKSVNKFIHECYEHYYMKLSKLNWGPFAPKPFGIFPMIAINFNVVSDYHLDNNDVQNGLCFLVALGDFEGGELCFPQLGIIVKLQPGQVVAFPSNLLLHGNLPITKGIRFSVVYFVHKGFFHNLRNFEKIKTKSNNEKTNADSIQEDLYNAQDLNLTQPRFKKPKGFQTKEPDEATDQRRYKINLKRARKGLKAEDPLVN